MTKSSAATRTAQQKKSGAKGANGANGASGGAGVAKGAASTKPAAAEAVKTTTATNKASGVGGSGDGSGEAAVPSPRAAIGGWLSGPQLEPAQDEWSYKGERLGLPESGPGSLADQGPRLGALFIDWFIAYLAALAVGWHPSTQQGQLGVLAFFAAEVLLLESLLGYTIGKRIFRIRVGRLGGSLTPLHVVARTVLLLLLVPAAIWDRDGRGMHDRLAGTVVVRR